MDIDENEFFREATIRICGSLSLETAMRRFLEFLSAFMPVFALMVGRFDARLDAIRVYTSYRFDKGEILSGILHVPKEASSEFDWDEGELVRIHDQSKNKPHTRTLAQALGKSDLSFLIMHMQRKGERKYGLGSLFLAAEGRDRFTHEHARLLALLNEPMAITVANALKHQELLRVKTLLADDNLFLNKELMRLSGDEIIGRDFGLKGVMEKVQMVAELKSPVLLLGETGTGKEVVANAIHSLSPRNKMPFIKVNCGAIPDSLVDSELFGHEKGAFTDAISQKRGRFERAQGGTILLDEIGELPLSAQIRLLRVLQNNEIERVGGMETIPLDIRVIASTHRSLEEMLEAGIFRKDLFYRLNVYPIMIPPLRERKGDIPALVHHFVERKSREMGFSLPPDIQPGVIDDFMSYNWPGNVRELENMVERALIQCRGGGLLVFENPERHTSPSKESHGDGGSRDLHSFDEMAVIHINNALNRAKGKISGPGGAAELLGLNPSTLRKKMCKLSIPLGTGKH